MPVERLTAEDQIMLWPDAIWPQDIGAIAMLDAPGLFEPEGRFRIEAVREAVAGRLHLVPRLRQLLYVPPGELGAPLWVDAPALEIADHVRQLPLPAPGDEAQLLLAVEQLRRRRLDRARPLWEMWFLTTRRDRPVGLFVRTHHCVADGIAGVATLATFLDVGPDSTASPGPAWTPAPVPSTDDLRADNRRQRIEERGRMFSTLAHPVRSARSVLVAWPAVHELLAQGQLPSTSLDRVVGPDRNFALIRSRLDVVKELAHTHDAKVNDVLLTVIAGGLRALLRSRGEAIEDLELRVYVPVSLRQGHFANATGNRIAQMVVSLPIGVADPSLRLRRIATQTARKKATNRPSIGKFPHGGVLGRTFLKLVDRQRVNVTTADLPGPPTPLYLFGARLLEVFPVLPLIGKISLGIGAISYAGQFNITAVADGASYPDLDTLAAGVRDELNTLEIKSRGRAVA